MASASSGPGPAPPSSSPSASAECENTEPKADCSSSPSSPVKKDSNGDTSPPVSAGEADKEGPHYDVKALQEEGKYDGWGPLLRDILPTRGASLLLGQIRFDVTTEDERGSWLLPEELLSHQGESMGDEQEERQVFSNTPVSEEEQRAIDDVVLHLLEMGRQGEPEDSAERARDALVGVQPAWLEQLILRYLHSCSFDRSKTLELLQSTLTFRTQHLPVMESEVYSDLRNMGACYWHGRDRKMRPLLVISLQRLQQLQREAAAEEKVTRLLIFCLEFFLRYLCVAGVVENWCILCDLNGTSIASFPLPLLLKLIQLIQGAYRGRLYRFYILHAPRLFHFVAKPLLASLPSSTAKKIRVFTQLDDWHQERRMQFADHQLEKKFGGTAPDITENWYPFHFFPGPFEPAAFSTPSGEGEEIVVRWKSERSLHARVHPSIHTGASLHTSLLWRRPIKKDQAEESASADERQTLRYAAWLHHLPELRLPPKAIRWARISLREDLVHHHHHLLHHLQNRPQEKAQALSSCAGETAPEPLSEDNACASLSNSSTRDASRMPTPPRGRCFAAATAAAAAAGMDSCAAALNQQTTAAVQDEHRSPTKSPQRGGAAASPVGDHQGLCEAALPEQAHPNLSSSEDPAAPLAAAAAIAAGGGQPQEQGPASLASEGCLHQQLLPGCHPCSLGDSCPAASQSGGHWASDRPMVTADGGSASGIAPCTSSTSAAAASCLRSSGEPTPLPSAQGMLPPCRSCGRKTEGGSCDPAACCSRAAAQTTEQQLAALTLRGNAADSLLSHPPHSPLARSVGCPCRTMSLSGVETAERPREGSPVPPGLQEAPVCQRSYPESCLPSCCGPPALPQLQQFRETCCSGNRRANSCCSSTLPPLLEGHEAYQQAPPWRWGAASAAAHLSRPISIGVVSRSGESARGPLVQAPPLPRFIPPVVAETSPSTSAFLPTISSSFESCSAACSDLHPGSPGPVVKPMVTLENPLGEGGFLSPVPLPSSEAPLSAKGHRSLGRMVRALYRSVSRSHITSSFGGGPEEVLKQQLPPKEAIRRRHTYADRWHRRVDRQQQVFDKRQPPEGRRRRLGLSMRLRGRWLSRQLQIAAAAAPANAPKAATAAAAKPMSKGRSRYSRLRLSRRRLRTTAAAARFAVAQQGEPLGGSEGGCGVWTAGPDSARLGTPSSLSSCSHSNCLFRLPHSISARVKRGSLVLATRMHRRRSAPGGST
ncbi:hypothetical protein Emag_002502 [Eimeria magna]